MKNTFKTYIYVTPNATSDSIKLKDMQFLHIFVTVPPEKNKANDQVIKILAKWLNIPKTEIRIVCGEKHRKKVIEFPKEYEPIYEAKLKDLIKTTNTEVQK